MRKPRRAFGTANPYRGPRLLLVLGSDSRAMLPADTEAEIAAAFEKVVEAARRAARAINHENR